FNCFLFFLTAPHTIHKPQTGRNSSRDGLLNAISPQSSPNQAHRPGVAVSSFAASPTPRIRNARTSTHEKRKAVSDISQIHFTAYCIAAGYSAQIHADHTATFVLKDRSAISHVVRTISAFSTQLIAISTKAESAVKTPKILNTPAISSGYAGVTHVVGPVCPRK